MKKRFLIAILFSVVTTFCFAQDISRKYISYSYKIGGNDDFVMSDFSLGVGYRFNETIALYVPIGIDMGMTSVPDGRTGNINGVLGLGASC